MQPLAPNQSKEHPALRESAPDVHMELALRKFLWEINAHWELISLPLVCQNVREILSLAVNVWQIDLEQFGLQSWREILDWIHKNEIQLSEAIGGHFAAQFSGQGTHPLMGDGVTRHSVHATLCNSHMNPAKHNIYRLLQAHLLFAKVAMMRKHTTMDEYESYSDRTALLVSKANPYKAALAVRGMSESGSIDLLEALPVHLPPGAFFQELPHVVSSATRDIQRYNNLVVFLRKALYLTKQEQRPYHSRRGDGAARPQIHGGSTSWLPVTRDDSPFEDPDDSNNKRPGHHSTATRSRHNAQEARERLEIDDCPEEDEEDEDNDRTGFDDDAFQREPGSFHEVSASQAMHIQMANQLFPWAYGELSISEITPFIGPGSQEYDTPETQVSWDEPMTENRLEVLALAQVMFWTSSSMKRAQGLKLLDSTTSGRYADLSLRLKTEDGTARWRIRAPLPHYRQPQSSVPEHMNRTQFDYLELPDVAHGSALVLKLMQWRNAEAEKASLQPPSSRSATRVFPHKISWYRRQFRELLPKGTRVTEGRLAKFLFTRILMESGGDLTATAIITGNDIQISKVKLFYACPLVSRLQGIYVDTATRVRNELWRTAKGPLPVTAQVYLDRRDVYIGSRLCPTLDAVQQAITRLKRELRDCSPTLDLQRHHNLLTLFTLLMFFYTTGVRGIRTPYVNILEIDTEFGLGKKFGIGILTDKDSGNGYKSRLVRFTPTLIEQMNCYKDFISRSPHVYRMRDATCFLLDPNLHPIEVRPRTLAPLLREFLPFPVNIHRRFISSELLDAGCPPEVVSAWMGHWHRGEEPWGKFSSFSFGDYCLALGEFLDPLLAKLGLCGPNPDSFLVAKL